MQALQSLTERMFRTPGILVGLVVLLCFIKWSSPRLRVKKLGGQAPAAVYWAPFGKPAAPVLAFFFFPELILALHCQVLTFLQRLSAGFSVMTSLLGHANF